MDTWNRLFFSHPSASVNSQLCRHYRALWLSARVMQSNQTLSSAVGGTAVCCSLHNPHLSVSRWKRTENSVPSWLLGVNSEQICSWSGAAEQPQSKRGHCHLHWLGDASALEINPCTFWNIFRSWKEAMIIPEPQSAGISVDSKSWTGRFEVQA